MTDDRRDTYNPPVETSQSPGEGGNSTANEPGNNAAPSLDTTLDTARTGGMGGMAGTLDVSVDTDRAGSAPAGELEDQ
ncbi:hypothetical protein DEIPH_ctg016orf0004 [Deinococcus phoenicis]|uniref:Uncharacterized protein n=1 Tax=Deinococcus phoenicis TaxID=1476583 RepID=A0A016QRT8_9DEIO|nr:hypothetical protein [Deinococcus phoenicis]EYB68860.1 hypothetical protein DEIPH_ctg016orf0004 [Deinococcus phoenicis]